MSSNTWYETSPSSSSRNHYNNNISNNTNSVVQQPDSSYDRHTTNTDLIDPSIATGTTVTTIQATAVTLPVATASTTTPTNPLILNSNLTSNLQTTKHISSSSSSLVTTPTSAQITTTETSFKVKLLTNSHHKSIKSRSGSESPVTSGRSSRSHSRSPSSCSTNSSKSNNTSTTNHSNDTSHSSPNSATGDLIHSTPSSHHHHNHRHHGNNHTGKSTTGGSHRRNLQASLASAVSIGLSSVDKTATTSSSTTSSLSSSGSTGNPAVHSEDNRPLAICVKNLPSRSSDTSLKDGLFHEYKKHGKVTWVKVVGQNQERYALVCFKKPEDVVKALEVSQDKLFFGCKIEVMPYQGFDVDDNEFRPYEAELDEYHPKSTRTLFIGNLEKDITANELRKHFECFGEILEIDIKKQGPSPYAFCQYADIVSVVKAMRKMDGEHLGKTRVKLGFGKSMPTQNVWIDGVIDTVSEGYLSQQFSRFGLVQKVIIDRERKLALVQFDQIQYAQTAVKEMRSVPLRGKKLQVDFASRECVEAFCGKIEKLTGGLSTNCASFESTPLVTPCAVAASSGTTPASRFMATPSSISRSRASSFSRPGNPVSGATSPNSTPSAGSTPRHLSSSCSVGGGRNRLRYGNIGSPEIFDSTECLDSLYSSSYDQDRGIEPDIVPNDVELNASSITSSSIRRRCDKSPGKITT